MIEINHFITFDRGSGPVSLVSFGRAPNESMMRLSHDAPYNAVSPVDPVAARKAVADDPDLGRASVKIAPELADRLAAEALTFASGMGCRSLALRWRDDGSAQLFDTEELARAWDKELEAKEEDLPQPITQSVVTTRRRVMMG